MGDQRSDQANSLESSRQRSVALDSKPPLVAQGHAHPLLQLQRQLGNRAVTHLIQTNLIQAKLSVSQPNDRYEQEADRTADTVMRMPDLIVQRQPFEAAAIQAAPIGRVTPLMQRQAEEEKEPVQMLQRQEEEKEPVQMLQRQEEEKEPIQAKATHTPDVSSNLETQIQSMRGGGQPLPASTRDFFEPRFGYDFSGVRVHTDSQANDAAHQLNAQAFTLRQDVFFGAGYYQPDTFQGRSLLAHELTHTVQQQPQPLSAATSAAQTTATTSVPSVQGAQRQSVPVTAGLGQVQRLFGIDLPGVDTVRNWAADRAANIPGFTLLTVILGRNPINDRQVDRNATNLIRGAMGLVPGGELIFQALQASGVIDRVAAWLQQQIAQLNLTWDSIMALLRQAWNAISITDPSGSVDRVINAFRPTLDRIRAFAAGVRDRVIAFVKEAILRPVSNFARGLSIYPLLTVILGKDPITDEVVERNATTVIGGILHIIPGGDEKFQQLQQSGIINRAYNWFNQELTRLNLTWNFIKSVFMRVWESLSVNDILSPIAAFNRISNIFSDPIQRVMTFAGSAIRQVAQFVFEGVLTLAGGLGQQVLGIFNRARSVISTIIENPIGFVGNLINALKRGFQQFSSNILTHLRAGLVGWLFGALAGAGLQLPERFDLRGIVSLVMQILGLTYAALRTILVRLIGEANVSRVERVFEFLLLIVTQGISAAWERIVEFAGNLQEMVMGGIRDWVARTIVGQAITRLVTLFNPAGAVIQAIMAAYNTVVFFIERAQQIRALVEAVFSSIATIASGNIGAAANFVEQTMARTIPVAISFLARLIGLGGISDQIRNVIRRIQAPIQQAMERVAGWIVAQVRRLGSAIVGGAQSVGQRVMNWLGIRKEIQLSNGEQHSLYFEQRGNRSVLMVATNPVAFRQFVNSIGSNPRLNNDKQYAIRLIDRIDSLEDDSRTNNVDHNNDIVMLVQELGRTTTGLMNAAVGHDVRTTPPVYAGLRDGFARGMRVMLATDDLRRGTPPSVTSPTFINLNLRKSGRGSYYILGHLLNEKLGGPGNRWENITPLSRSGNGQHETQVESFIKPTTGDTPRAFLYVVTPSYGRTLNTGLIAQINGPSNSDSSAQKAAKVSIVTAEQYAPTNMVCSIQEIDPLSGRAESGMVNETYSIPNEIDQSSPTAYQL